MPPSPESYHTEARSEAEAWQELREKYPDMPSDREVELQILFDQAGWRKARPRKSGSSDGVDRSRLKAVTNVRLYHLGNHREAVFRRRGRLGPNRDPYDAAGGFTACPWAETPEGRKSLGSLAQGEPLDLPLDVPVASVRNPVSTRRDLTPEERAEQSYPRPIVMPEFEDRFRADFLRRARPAVPDIDKEEDVYATRAEGWEHLARLPLREMVRRMVENFTEEQAGGKPEGPDWREQAERMKAEQRAKTKIRRLLLAHSLETMWTLTFAGNVTDLQEALKMLRKFLRKVRNKVCTCPLEERTYTDKDGCQVKAWRKPRECPCFKYVCVPEPQEERAAKYGYRVWHFHLAVNLKWLHGQVAPLWGHGFVWVKLPSRNKEKRVAGYMTKYLSKTFEREEDGTHRYTRSRNMDIPFEEIAIEPGDISEFEALLTRDGFEKACELLPIVVEGRTWGWFCASMRAPEDARPEEVAPARAAGAEDAPPPS